MNGYRFDVEYILETEDDIDNAFDKKNQYLKEVSRYVRFETDYNPIMKSNIQSAKDDISYGSRAMDRWRRVTIKMIFSPKQLGENFNPDQFQRKIKDAFSGSENFARVEYRELTSL